MKISVVNKFKQPNHIYCGRGSALGNPFILKNEAQRDEVCDKYDTYFKEQIAIGNKPMLAQLQIIKDATTKGDVNLGCFCAPKRCHCETIKSYIEGL